ncbi:MAG: hypothetical protein ACI8X5_002101 [Planctomycetota bacterium]
MNAFQGVSASANSQIAEERVVDTLSEILKGEEFDQSENFLGELLADFFAWIGELGFDVAAEDAAAWGKGLWILIAVAAGAWLTWFWLSVLKSRSAQPAKAPLQLSDDVAQRVKELQDQAREAQVAGDLTRALRLYFFALVVGLGERGELDYNDAWTNRELLERGEPQASIVKLLRPMVRELDEHSFGMRLADPEDVQRFAGACEELLGGGAN